MKREIDAEQLQKMLCRAYDDGRDYQRRIVEGALAALGLVKVDKALLAALEECGRAVELLATLQHVPDVAATIKYAVDALRNAKGKSFTSRAPSDATSFEIEAPAASKAMTEQIGLELIAGRLRIKTGWFVGAVAHLELETVGEEGGDS